MPFKRYCKQNNEVTCLNTFFQDSFEMIVEDMERGIRFVVPYHYESLVRDAGETFNPRRMKRLAQEAVTLSSSLPLSYSSSVFVRTDVDRLDVMKVRLFFFFEAY